MKTQQFKEILKYRLIKTKRRITFEIIFQDMDLFCGRTDDDYDVFKACNGIEIISRSRMDVQTDRLWLLGCGPDERSGSMVFSSDEKRDRMFILFQDALVEWGQYIATSGDQVMYNTSELHILDKDTFQIVLS
jgi:hypothetical protein